MMKEEKKKWRKDNKEDIPESVMPGGIIQALDTVFSISFLAHSLSSLMKYKKMKSREVGEYPPHQIIRKKLFKKSSIR